MNEDSAFAEMMNRLRAGDNEAAAEVYRRFVDALLALAKGHLDRLFQSKVDPEDILQSVYRSFFLRIQQGQFELTGWSGLWGLLSRITLHKCLNRQAHFRAAKRDAAREVDGQDYAILSQVLGPAPSPDEAVHLIETVQRWLGALDPSSRGILERALQGLSTREISAQTGWAERTVRRALERGRIALERELHRPGG